MLNLGRQCTVVKSYHPNLIKTSSPRVFCLENRWFPKGTIFEQNTSCNMCLYIKMEHFGTHSHVLEIPNKVFFMNQSNSCKQPKHKHRKGTNSLLQNMSINIAQTQYLVQNMEIQLAQTQYLFQDMKRHTPYTRSK